MLNTGKGVYGISRGGRSPATAVSAGAETLGYALLEAHAQYSVDSATPVLLIYADEPADERYGSVDHEMPAGALAILLDPNASARLECAAGPALAEPGRSVPVFSTQGEALMHGLAAGAAVAWEGLGRRWQWSLHASGAV